MKTKYWVLLFVTILIVCTVISCLILFTGPSSSIVGIYSDGELIRRIDLSKVVEEYEFEVKDKAGGYNVISVERNCIRIIQADCNDHTCIEHGYLDSGAPIICFPHRLVIKWLNKETGYDAVTGI